MGVCWSEAWEAEAAPWPWAPLPERLDAASLEGLSDNSGILRGMSAEAAAEVLYVRSVCRELGLPLDGSEWPYDTPRFEELPTRDVWVADARAALRAAQVVKHAATMGVTRAPCESIDSLAFRAMDVEFGPGTARVSLADLVRRRLPWASVTVREDPQRQRVTLELSGPWWYRRSRRARAGATVTATDAIAGEVPVGVHGAVGERCSWPRDDGRCR